jgi:parallel beta-helix repeat protein
MKKLKAKLNSGGIMFCLGILIVSCIYSNQTLNQSNPDNFQFHQPNAQNVKSVPNPIVSYDFNEGQGSIVIDKSGNGHTGTIYNAQWTEGIMGSALYFNGNSYVESVNYNFSKGNWTFDAWIYTSVDGSAIDLFNIDGGEVFGSAHFRLLMEGRRLKCVLKDAYGNYMIDWYISDSVITPNEWHYVAFMSENSEFLYGYIDGVMYGPYNLNNAGNGYWYDGDPVWIGHGGEAWWIGKMDEVSIYDRKLTLEELNYRYNRPNAISTREYLFLDGNDAIANFCNESGMDGTVNNPYIIENTVFDYSHITTPNSYAVLLCNINVHVILRNCTLIGYSNVLGLYNVSNIKIENNTIFNPTNRWQFPENEVGIYLHRASDLVIANNTFYNVDIGILYLDTGENINATGNQFTDNGIIFGSIPNPNIIIDNTNLVNGKSIYWVVNAQNLNEANFPNASQIILYNCQNISLDGIYTLCGTVGLQGLKSRDISIKNSRIGPGWIGTDMIECQNTFWENNSFDGVTSQGYGSTSFLIRNYPLGPTTISYNPMVLEVEYGQSNISAKWNLIELYNPGPYTYILYQDAIQIENGTWIPGLNFTYNPANLEEGYHYIQLILFNGLGFNTTAHANIRVVGFHTSHPEDKIIEQGSMGNTLNWTVKATNIGNTSYSIRYVDNNTIIDSNTWYAGQTIFLSIDGLPIGTYMIQITFNDGLGNEVTDIVQITVIEPIPPSFPPSTPYLSSITPNPNHNGTIILNWNSQPYVTYYVYRSTTQITQIGSLNYIGTTTTSHYIDNIQINGTFYYVVVANNASGTSNLSNCRSVTVAIPTTNPNNTNTTATNNNTTNSTTPNTNNQNSTSNTQSTFETTPFDNPFSQISGYPALFILVIGIMGILIKIRKYSFKSKV